MVGCVLAGGLGSRLGGDKARTLLGGRPLVAYALDALRALGPRLDDVVVVAKPSTPLPGGVPRWDEPEEPRHPLTGIVAALHRAQDDVLVLAADLPLLRAADLEPLLAGDGVRWVEGEPLVAVYPLGVLEALRDAPPGAPLRATVRALGPRAVGVDPQRLVNVNTPEDLARAEDVLGAVGPG